MNKVVGLFFAGVCFAISAISSSIVGAGMWFWVIIVVGLLVAVSQYHSPLRGIGSGLAVLLGAGSICAVALGILAATVGGSFNLNDREALLLFLLFMIFILGLVLGVLHIKARKKFIA